MLNFYLTGKRWGWSLTRFPIGAQLFPFKIERTRDLAAVIETRGAGVQKI